MSQQPSYRDITRRTRSNSTPEEIPNVLPSNFERQARRDGASVDMPGADTEQPSTSQGVPKPPPQPPGGGQGGGGGGDPASESSQDNMSEQSNNEQQAQDNPENSPDDTTSDAEMFNKAIQKCGEESHAAAAEANAVAARYNGYFDRVARRISQLNKHKNGKERLTPIQIKIIQGDLKDHQSKIAELGIYIYEVIPEGILLDSMGNEALKVINHCYHELQDSFDRAYNYVMELEVSEQAPPRDQSAGLRPPKMSIPKFTGLHREWPQFKANFRNLTANLTPVDQLRMLIEATKNSEAYDSIKDLALTGPSWYLAWKRITDRYDSPREIVSSALRPVLEMPKIPQQSASALYGLVSTVRTTIAQLAQANYGNVPVSHLFYVHLLYQAMDAKTLAEFNNTLTDDHVPPLEQVLTFLEKRAKDISLSQELQTSKRVNTPNRGNHPQQQQQQQRGNERRQFTPALHAMQKQQRPPPPKPKNGPMQKGQERNQGGGQQGGVNQANKPKPWKANCGFCSAATHRSMTCPNYTEKPLPQRKDMVRKHRLCFSCLSANHLTKDCKSLFKCVVCGGHHHSSLHQESTPANQGMHHLDIFGEPIGILPTALVMVNKHEQQTRYHARAMLDCGAQGSYITEALATTMGLEIHPTQHTFTVATQHKINCLGSTTFVLQSRTRPNYKLGVHAYVLPVLTGMQPSEEFDTSSFIHLRERDDLADPHYNIPGQVDIILGMPEFNEIMSCGSVVHGKRGQPTAYASQLGWVVMGIRGPPSHAIMAIAKEQNQAKKQAVGMNLEKFWEIEELPEPPLSASYTEEELFCEDHYKNNTKRLPNGRYQVSLPFVGPTSALGSSFQQARMRWLAVERKLLRQPEIYREYQAQMKDHIDNGRMELVPEEELYPKGKPVYFIPHHGILKPESTSTKLRVVFDASAKTTTGESLNDLLPAGPTIQRDLFGQLIHFRENEVAVKGDIKKMYLQILVEKGYQEFQRILWRETPDGEVQQYRLTTVTFGVKVSPYLAVKTLENLSEDEKENFPTAAETLKHCFYVDDLSTSIVDEEKAITVYKELRDMLASAGFEICKWSSNSKRLLELIPDHDKEISDEVSITESDTVKTLGLKWSPSRDVFFFVVKIDLSRPHTKRDILSEISKIFDPLGLLSPVVIKAKVLIQSIWVQSLGWDDRVPEEISQGWSAIAESFNHIADITIPRPLRLGKDGVYTLVSFSDSSNKAYAACVYLIEETASWTRCNLVAAKTKVAPMQPLTMPRMELQGAVLQTQLMTAVKAALSMKITASYYWTDAAIVLWWINKKPHEWKLFVRNRVAFIQQHTKPEQWAHVATEENPADCATRGLTPEELKDHPLWWNGPPWLLKSPIVQPPIPGMPKEVDLEASTSSTLLTIQRDKAMTTLQALERIGGYTKITRTLARIHQIFREKTLKTSKNPLLMDINRAEITLARLIQKERYGDAVKALQEERDSDKSLQQFKTLRPFLDYYGVMRVGGRLEQSDLPFNAKHPMILPGNHDIIKMYILELHTKLAHAPRRTILNHLRATIWLVQGMKSIKAVLDKCLLCHRYSAPPENQLMGQLPSARVSYSRPFTHVGIDLAGPYTLRNFTGRGGHFKCWICLYTCMLTRAIHLEIVSTLSAEGFLLSFRRFIGRRGKPTNVYCDNGTNFVGAYNHLEDNLAHLQLALKDGSNAVPGLELDKIEWSFNPPSGPNFGGAWEACVRLVKLHLREHTTYDTLTYERFETLMISIEAIVNSRPLTPLDEDINSLQALTPAHFLIGENIHIFPELSPLPDIKINRLNLYEQYKKRFNELWVRFQTDYITNLQRMQKWQQAKPNLKVGEMVLVMDHTAPPLHWKIGRVKEVFPGRDNKVRVMTVDLTHADKTKDGTIVVKHTELTRPISKVVRLPEEPSIQEEPDRPEKKSKFAHHINKETTGKTTAAGFILAMIFNNIHQAKAQSPADMPPTATVIIGTLAIVLAITGVVCNITAIIRILCLTKKKQPLHQYQWSTLCLHTSDLIMAAIIIPLTAMRFLTRSWPLGITTCRIYSFLLYGTVSWTLSNLIMIAFVRSLCLVTVTANITTTVKRIMMILPPINYLLPALALASVWGQIDIKPEDPSSCTILPLHGHSPKELIWIIGVCIPYLLIHVMSSVIYFRIRQQHKLFPESSRRSKTLARLRNTIIGVLISFLFGYQPILTLNALDNKKTQISPYIHVTSMFMAWCTTVIHPVIYLFKPMRKRLSRVPRPQVPIQSTDTVNQTNRMKRIRVIITSMLILQAPIGADSSEITTQEPTAITGIPKPEEVKQFEAFQHFPVPLPMQITQLPICSEINPPVKPIPKCTNAAYWLSVRSDASACVNFKKCLPGMVMNNDASSCYSAPLTACPIMKYKKDDLTCQTRALPANQAAHIMMRELLPEYCAIGNLHLKNCNDWKDVIKDVAVVLIKGVIHPVAELHLSEDAVLKDLSSYNCTCTTGCLQEKCTGDSIFCKNIGCITDFTEAEKTCQCVYAHKQPITALHTKNGIIYPQCWGYVTAVVKAQIPSEKDPDQCEHCEITCEQKGVTVNTPGKVAKYIRISKNPGHISSFPEEESTLIPLTTHMLVTPGEMTVEIWMPSADAAVIIKHTCPRQDICQVITCRLCYDRWINVRCYNSVNWIILLMITIFIAFIILCITFIIRTSRTLIWILTWPCRKVWKRKVREQSLPTQRIEEKEEEEEIPLVEVRSQPVYRTTTVKRTATRRGPLLLSFIIATCCFNIAQGCAEFSSMSASSSECKKHGSVEECSIQLSTRLGISPIGQTSCFRIKNSEQTVIGTIEIKTNGLTVKCIKETLYYVPRPKVNCISHLQCYSLYSSSSCHGDKCTLFPVNGTIEVFETTKHNLGWSYCVSLRIPTCIWWLTRDCHFLRTSFTNPTGEVYEAFSCPQWKFAARAEVTIRLGTQVTTKTVTLHPGLVETIQGISFEVIAESIPPTPLLNQCFLKKGNSHAVTPCNQRGEIMMGRIGELQCDSVEAASTITPNCSGTQGLVTFIPDSEGVRCSSALIDPEMIIQTQPLPLKIENGVLTAVGDSVEFDTTASALLELQITSRNLTLTAAIQQGTCSASFLKIEGCYSCLGGAVVFMEASTSSSTEVTGTLECPKGQLFSQFQISNQTSVHKLIVHADTPEILMNCEVVCPLNKIPILVKGHLHYLSNPTFRNTETSFSFHPVSSSSLDFHWLSLSGFGFTTWLTRGATALAVIIFLLLICYCLVSHTVKKLA